MRDQPFRQPSGKNRDAQLGQDVGQSADVVFVTMRDENRPHLVPVFEEVADVGDHKIDPEQLVLGKHEAGVDDDDVVAILDGRHVLTDLGVPA